MKMKALIRSPLTSAVLGGLVVAVAFLLLGVTGRRTTQTIVEEGPVAAAPASTTHSGLTAHAIYVRDAPGVVFVRAQQVEQVQNPFELFPRQQSSVATGSGFLIDRTGRILTNYHLIEGANQRTGVTVQFEDDINRRAVVIAQAPDNDLALLQVDMSGVPSVDPLPLGDSTSVQVGDPTLAIGNPFGLDRTLTSGIVSALQREIQAPDGFTIDNVIQTDAPINPGNSGGPLLDGAGRVIGINSQIATLGAGGNGSVGIGFAIPINTAKAFLPQLHGGALHPAAYLGLGGVTGAGSHRAVIVTSVAPGGPAATAGLRAGERITSIDGNTVDSIAQLQKIIDAGQVGQAVSIHLLDGTHARSVRVVLASPPQG